MPKVKTKRAAAKRFKVTGTGKLKRMKAYKSHILTKKTTKTVKVATKKKLNKKIKGLKSGKKYYVRVRATKTNYAGNAIYSKWVKKSVKTKK